MPSQTPPDPWMPVDRRLLAAMIDNLVAVQLDLKPLCADTENKPQDAKAQTIAVACGVLQSAIDDLKAIIFRLEGFSDMVESPPSSMKTSGSA